MRAPASAVSTVMNLIARNASRDAAILVGRDPWPRLRRFARNDNLGLLFNSVGSCTSAWRADKYTAMEGIMTGSWLTRLGWSALIFLALATPGHTEAVKKHPTPKHPAETIAGRRLGGAGSWSAYIHQGKSGPVCYLAGAPQKTEPPRFKRRPPSATVTHRPKENVFNVVNFDEGYLLKPGSDASLDIDGQNFDLFTNGDGAWSRTSDLDRTIVEAMAKGRRAVLKASPAKGPQTTDTYSLAGFTQTLALIDKACGVKR